MNPTTYQIEKTKRETTVKFRSDSDRVNIFLNRSNDEIGIELPEGGDDNGPYCLIIMDGDVFLKALKDAGII